MNRDHPTEVAASFSCRRIGRPQPQGLPISSLTSAVLTDKNPPADVATYALGIFGILISVTLFLIGYRTTVGARRERVAAANTDLEKTLLRRIVLDKYSPTLIDLSRLIDGKARDNRVRSGEMLSDNQVLTTLYTRVMESDLIPSEQREVMLGRIVPALSASEFEPIQEQAIEELAFSKRRLRQSYVTTALMAFLASGIGALIAVVPQLRTLQPELRRIFPLAAMTAAGSLAAIATAYAVFSLKSDQESDLSSRASELSEYVNFEAQVQRVLEDIGAMVRPSRSDQGFDFLLVEHMGKKLLIEVKAWLRPIPSAILGRLAERLRTEAKRIGADESIIVAKASDESASGVVRVGEGDVKIMTLRQLRNHILHS